MSPSQSSESVSAEDLVRIGVLDPQQPIRRIDTHAATVYLNGDHAWKLKRPVRFRYLDFSTEARRRDALKSELHLNRRTAPALYHAVHAIRRDATGGLHLGGEAGEPIDWVLEMTRFPDDALLVDRTADGLDDRLLAQLAARVADLNAQAEPYPDPRGADRLQEVVDGNLGSMSAFPDILDPALAAELTERLTAMIDDHRGLLDARAAAGRVRRGHGDLHLKNIAVVDGEPLLFDCLEFDAEMATTDVLYDLGFLLMDLWARGMRHEANTVLNSYLDLAPEDEDGYRLMPLILGVRATVRAHVSAAEAAVVRAREYLELALGFTRPEPARLIAVGGASGTGKTTVSRAVAAEILPPPGARILRSDILRKRLAGVSARTRLPRDSYTAEASARVYDEIARLAEQNLRGGMSVIVDAVSGRAAERDRLAALADATDTDFTGIWLELPEAQRISRIAGRGPDASDADAEVARRQTAALEVPGDEWATVVADDGAYEQISPLLRG